MQKFNGLNMLKIDIANNFGLDKEDWIVRLIWVEEHLHELDLLAEQAEKPLLYIKACKALEATLAGKKSGHVMFLDATASGLQIMSVLAGCHKTARHVNLINTGKREDVYVEVVDLMNKQLSATDKVSRGVIKLPLMTNYYNKLIQDTLSEDQQTIFYEVLRTSFEGAEKVKEGINMFWNSKALAHTWTLPDGHVAHVKVTGTIGTEIEVDELDHATFTYYFVANEPSKKSTSLVANIVHSIDAYIAREMIVRAYEGGFQLVHIHDAFGAHPNYMQEVREIYVDILIEISKSNLLKDILEEISGEKVKVEKLSNNLHEFIRESDYALS